uniref:Striatin n=1 Tax=Scleropages formosus TaxID=113540 RepID=A0A8C9VJA6_SCLFO
MDEQAGPGVFFNNNNSATPGAGKGAPADGDAGEAARAQYSIPGILHFLQHEWARFEVERAQWDVERAELQAQIAFLQGERKGQENLKKDLVRRIKMLEYALKQERAKYHKMKYGTELNQGDLKPPTYNSENRQQEPRAHGKWHRAFVQGRPHQRVRKNLSYIVLTCAWLSLGCYCNHQPRTFPPLSSDSTHLSPWTFRKPDLMDASSSVLEAFRFIESAAAEFSDEDEDDDSDRKDKTVISSATVSCIWHDPDTENALKGFDFLSSPEEMDTSPDGRSSGEGSDWDKEEPCPVSEAWDVDQGLISKLKEQYRKERKGKKGVKRPNRSKLQDMLANLRDVEDLPPVQPSVTPPARPPTARLGEPETGRTDEVEAMTFPPTTGKSFIMGADDAMECELGLGELAGLTVANEADALTYDMANNKDALRKTWNPKFTLRSHFDAIRGLAFHPLEPVLVTASEDHTLKMWNLQKTAPAKKSASLDVEPIYTFRAHRGSVLCVVMSTSGEQCFSGGVDGTIQSWNTPNPNIDPYDSYEPSVLRGALCGHTDAVWGLVYSSAHQRLLSCSADGTVRLWNAADTSPALAIFNENAELGIPSSVDLVCSDPAHMVTSFSSGRTGLFNMETRQLVLSLVSAEESGTVTLAFLAVDPNGLYLMSGSHDCSIRLWNLESKTCIQEFTAHRKKFDEAIHDVAFHPSRCYIASAGADALAKVFV